GYHASRMDWAKGRGIPPELMISRSSFQKGWRKFLDELTIDPSSFTCSICGVFPNALVCDGICLGSRADIGATLPNRPDTPIRTIDPGWLGNKRERFELKEFSKGVGGIPTGTPPSFLPFIESASLPDQSINPIYSDLIFLMFADSPVPDILKVFEQSPHPDHFYGPIEESHLDYFPSWPKIRGLAKYDRDRRRDEMDCSRKDIVGHSTLSPGVLLMCCPHRVTYGFSILDSTESPRSVFRVLASRFPPEYMPEIVIYDNS
ncbi:hypothetical protein PENTCL1PPCAC_2593, partial [Pristionchus entomophagus]